MGILPDGKFLIASARDIGNYIAGYVAGAHGLPWDLARIGFDSYESLSKKSICAEGISTQRAEFMGWRRGFTDTPWYGMLYNIGKTKFSIKILGITH